MAEEKPLAPPLTPEQLAKAKFLEDFAALMGNGRPISNAMFRRWLMHLVEDAGWCASFTYLTDPTMEEHALRYALGRRALGQQLLQTAMGLTDESYRRMLLESIDLKTKREFDADYPPNT